MGKNIIDIDITKLKEGSPVKVSGRYSDKPTKEEPIQSPSRISNALSESVIANTQSIERKYNITIQDNIVRNAVDENGRVPKLSTMQKKILLSLESHLTQLTNKPEIKEYIEKLKRGENPHGVEDYISLEELCSDIYGPAEKWKSEKQKEIKKELKKLSEIRQLQIYKVKALDNGIEREGLAKLYAPYFAFTGEERQYRIGKRTATEVKIRFGRIFLERISDRFFTILPSFWQSRKSNGEKIRTDHFISLAYLAFNLSWSHYYIELPKAEKQIESQNIINPEHIKEIKLRALTHEPIHFDRLKDIIKGKTEQREQKRRFKEYLWEAMWSLIDYGLLSDMSSIDWERETFTLVYNEFYGTPKQIPNPTEVGRSYWRIKPEFLGNK